VTEIGRKETVMGFKSGNETGSILVGNLRSSRARPRAAFSIAYWAAPPYHCYDGRAHLGVKEPDSHRESTSHV
jgi:hypothetical protein